MQRGFAIIALTLAVPAAGTPKSPGSVLVVVSASEPGERLVLTGSVVDSHGQPVAGAQVHVYQTDATGRYTRERAMDEAHARLAGWLQTDTRGQFELQTIRPGGYPKALRLGDRDRLIPAHIHIDVTCTGYRSRKAQAVFADDPLLADPYWQDWATAAHHPVLSATRGPSQQSATVVLTLHRVDPP